MTKEEFNKKLEIAGLSKADFAKRLKTAYITVANWGTGKRGIPYWVESWLDLYIENKKCKELKEALEKSGICDKIK